MQGCCLPSLQHAARDCASGYRFSVATPALARKRYTLRACLGDALLFCAGGLCAVCRGRTMGVVGGLQPVGRQAGRRTTPCAVATSLVWVSRPVLLCARLALLAWGICLVSVVCGARTSACARATERTTAAVCYSVHAAVVCENEVTHSRCLDMRGAGVCGINLNMLLYKVCVVCVLERSVLKTPENMRRAQTACDRHSVVTGLRGRSSTAPCCAALLLNFDSPVVVGGGKWWQFGCVCASGLTGWWGESCNATPA